MHSFRGGLEIRLRDRVLQAAAAGVLAAVDIDHRECFGVIDDDVAAARQQHTPRQGTIELLFYAPDVEERLRRLMQLDAVDELGATRLMYAATSLRSFSPSTMNREHDSLKRSRATERATSTSSCTSPEREPSWPWP